MTPKTNLPRLDVTRLEARDVPAAVSSYLAAGGVLTVMGTDSADTVVLRQTAEGRVSLISGGKTTVYSGVRSIYADGHAGNDYVYVDTTRLGGNEIRLAVKATLLGGSGNDTIVGGANADFIDGGSGNDSMYGNAGSDTLQGADGIDLISAGAGSDSIDGGAGNDKLYGGAANDRISGSSGDDYVDGGTGTDTLAGGSGFDTFHNSLSNGDSVIADGDLQDVRQGLSGTCVVLASLLAIEGTGVDLAGRIHQVSDNYYTVPVFRSGTGWVNQVVYFDGTWTDNDPAPTADGKAWVLLYQRAYLQETGVNWMDKDANGWVNRYGDEFQRVDRAFSALTGRSQWIGSRTLYDSDLTTLRSNFSGNKAQIALTRQYGSSQQADLTRLGLVTSHAYSVIGFGTKNGQTTVKLRNPWGTDGPIKYGADDGIIEIAWGDFKKVMLGFAVS